MNKSLYSYSYLPTNHLGVLIFVNAYNKQIFDTNLVVLEKYLHFSKLHGLTCSQILFKFRVFFIFNILFYYVFNGTA